MRFLGPFQLPAGKSAQHQFPIPEYVGSVRVMVVAGSNGAYGSTEKSVFVRQPLMLLATLPRVIGPGEELTVPVSLFVMEDSIREVSVEIATDELFEVEGPSTVKASFTGTGEKVVFLKLRAKDRVGKSTVRFRAASGAHRASSEVHLDLRSANPPTTRAVWKMLEPGEAWEPQVQPHGISGTNAVTLEVAAVPPLDLERRLDYLVRYPHGCLEQTTSSVFPQLYLPKLLRLEPDRQKEIEGNIRASIQRLRGFQNPAGSFLYWQGGFWVETGNDPRNSWVTSYAGHFLVEANLLGYAVPPPMLASWVKHQKSAAQSWSPQGPVSRLDQGYRLYTLALAGQPELGAMNRLRESGGLTAVEKWQLAAAYRLAGLGAAAFELVSGDRGVVDDGIAPDATFGSSLRDRALILNAMVTLEREDGLQELASRVSSEIASDQWHSTHAVSMALLAMARFTGGVDLGTPSFEYQIDSRRKQTVAMAAPIATSVLREFPDAGSVLRVQNPSNRRLFANVVMRGVAQAGEEDAASSGLTLDVSFTDSEGEEVAIEKLAQGEDFIAHVSVGNTTGARVENLALSHVFPSGWEILSSRLDPAESRAQRGLDYEDVRDDRVYRYFGLNPGESKRFATRLNAAYLGRYYLPAVSVEAMYDSTKNARTRGAWVQVTEEGRR